MLFYLLDVQSRNNALYLFGKTLDNKSVCLIVKNLFHYVYVVPRSTMTGVTEELLEIRKQRKITHWQTKPVKKMRCFVDGLGSYLKVKYPRTFAPLPSSLSGKTFSQVIGTQTSPVEQLLVKRKIKGPSWLLIDGVSREYVVPGGIKSITVYQKELKPPTLSRVVITINPEVTVDGVNILGKSKRAKLIGLITKVHHCDPDIIIGDRERLQQQVKKWNISTWSRLAWRMFCPQSEQNNIALLLQLTKIAGNLLRHTLLGGRANRVEYLLLHAFHAANYLVPDKNFGVKTKGTYTGGLVLTPRTGFYDKYVLLLDFNSLYPSIIMEYDIGFTNNDSKHKVLPRVIKSLVDQRAAVRNCDEEAQLALKLTANSVYGCLGYKNARFYAFDLAKLITRKGRELLQSTADMIRSQMNLDVIYGDTDSVLIDTKLTDLDKVLEMGNAVKKAVNQRHRVLRIEIDGVFKSTLLLKKKKYAAIKLTIDGNRIIRESREIKGLDMVRRDWCDLSRDIGTHVLDRILAGEKQTVKNVHSYVENAANNKNVPIEKFIIRKKLSKDPSKYTNKSAHVTVALRQKLHKEEIVEYVMCFPNEPFHPSEIHGDPMLVVDRDWYIKHQILPSVNRLCGFTATAIKPVVETKELYIRCGVCDKTSVFQGPNLLCGNCESEYDPVYFYNQLTFDLKHRIDKYYKMSVSYSSQDLLEELFYLRKLFGAGQMKELVQSFIDRNARNTVDIKQILLF